MNQFTIRTARIDRPSWASSPSWSPHAAAPRRPPPPSPRPPPRSAAAVETATPPPAVTPPPIAPGQPGPNGGVVVSWFVGLGAGGQPQQLPGGVRSSSTTSTRPEGRLHRRWRSRTTTWLPTSSRPGSRPAPRRTSSGRSGSKASTSSAISCSTSRRSSPRRTTASPVSIPSWSTSSSSVRTTRRSASRSRPTRRSCTSTRTCSTRPTCRIRRPRSVTCTKASRGTWTRSGPSP